MSSGVAVNDDCVTVYNELKLGHKSKFVIFRITDDYSSIVVDHVAPTTDTYDTFESSLPPNDCRYAVYDFEWDAQEGKRGKILFVLWAPDAAKVKSKMLYTSSKDNLRKKLVGVGTEIQATDRSEISYDYVLEKVNRK